MQSLSSPLPEELSTPQHQFPEHRNQQHFAQKTHRTEKKGQKTRAQYLVSLQGGGEKRKGAASREGKKAHTTSGTLKTQ
jgi:hypothetical protein